MTELIAEHRPIARKTHFCEECGQEISPGTRYTSQRCKDGGDVWTFKAHTDCMDWSQAYRTKHKQWHPYGGFIPMYDLVELHEFNEWRGLFPHAVCRLAFHRIN